MRTRSAVDLTDRARSSPASALVEEHEHLDILLNNAEHCLWSGFLESTLEIWDRTLATNLTAVYLLAREAARPMIAQRWGRIINVGSYVSVIGRERLQAYVASKHGLVGLTNRSPARSGATT